MKTDLSATQKAKVNAMFTKKQVAELELQTYISAIAEDRGITDDYGFDLATMDFLKKPKKDSSRAESKESEKNGSS